MIFNSAQADFLQSTAKETFLCGGVGLGKSFCIGILAYEAAKNFAGSVTLIASPTYDSLRNSTMRQVIDECWQEKIKLTQGFHYVINEMPPPEWKVKPYSELSNVRVVTWRNGSYTILDTLDNYNKHRGSSYDRILIDEFQNVTPDVRKVLLARLRGKVFSEAKQYHQIYYALTPPNRPEYMQHLIRLYQEWQGKNTHDMQFVFGESYLNEENLPDGYLESLTSNWDDRTVQREVYAQLVMDNAGVYAYAFDEEKHIKGLKLNPDLPLHLCFDFNLGIMATTVWQIGEHFCYCIDEFPPQKGIDIIERCATIRARYGDYLRGCIVTGDPATGSSGLKRNMNFYTLIKSELDLDDWQFHVKRSHPESRDANVLVNSMFSRFPDLKIHPQCSNLIHDLKFCVTDDDGKLDKTNHQLTHYLDTLVYFFDYNFKAWYLHK